MKKAKSQAVACSLDPNKNGLGSLHNHDFNSPDNDAVFDPSSMSLDEDLKPDEPSGLHSGRAVVANLSQKKATPPQPKKLVIKLKGLVLDPSVAFYFTLFYYLFWGFRRVLGGWFAPV